MEACLTVMHSCSGCKVPFVFHLSQDTLAQPAFAYGELDGGVGTEKDVGAMICSIHHVHRCLAILVVAGCDQSGDLCVLASSVLAEVATRSIVVRPAQNIHF